VHVLVVASGHSDMQLSLPAYVVSAIRVDGSERCMFSWSPEVLPTRPSPDTSPAAGAAPLLASTLSPFTRRAASGW
jgi:hypothetical protein